MAWDRLWSLLHQSSAQGTRSTVLAPMIWALSLLLVGLLVGQQVKLPPWCLTLLGVAIAVLLLNFLAMNWYFAIKDPDALRSERFILTKLAMRQKNFKGDNLIGFVRALSDNEETPQPNDGPTDPTVLIDEKFSSLKPSGANES